jgi:SH3 domain protein
MAVTMLTPVEIQAEQKTVYVSDIFYVPLRSGNSNKHRIIHRGLKSGTPLTLIESDLETKLSRVSTSTGIEGWIQSQYLSETMIARTQLQDIRATHQS